MPIEQKEFSVSQIKNGQLGRFKRCLLKRLPEFNAYGFVVTPNQKPKYSIYEVDVNSPAYHANLRKTDVIIEVNKVNIRQMKFDKVLRLLKNDSIQDTMEILAITLDGYHYYKDRNKKFSSRKLVTEERTDLYST